MPVNGYDPATVAFNMRAVNNHAQIFWRFIYFQASLAYSLFFPRSLRKVPEFIFLFVVVSIFYINVNFYIYLNRYQANSTYHYNCLDHVRDIWPKNGVLRVELIESYQHIIEQKEDIDNQFSIVEKYYVREYRVEYVLDKRNGNWSLFNDFIKTFNFENKEVKHSRAEFVENKFKETNSPKPNLYPRSSTNNRNVKEIFYDNYVMEYSLNKDYLSLTSNARNYLGIPVMLVTLDPARNKCFGNLANRILLKHFIGYDILLINSLKAVSNGTNGFLRIGLPGNDRLIKIGKQTGLDTIRFYFKTFIFSIFFTIMITWTVSYYLIFSFQQLFQIIVLSTDFNEGIRLNLVNPSALVMVFVGYFGQSTILNMYFEDEVACYIYTAIVLVAEIFYNLSHCPTTKKHWPKFFYLYIYLLFVYDSRFHGLCRLSVFICVCLLILHSMIYFYHNYELPYLEQNIEEIMQLYQHFQPPDGAVLHPEQEPED